jgi:hypothetical protein
MSCWSLSARVEMLLKPCARQSGHTLKRARLLKQMPGARHYLKARLARERLLRAPVELQHLDVAAADDQ